VTRYDEDDFADDTSGDFDENDDDAADTLPCPNCGREIYDEAQRCPHCGQYIAAGERASAHPPWVVITAVLCVLIALLWMFQRFLW
jgi:predicted RNA-binding Zn-ribbon protein involved in translation (DUF1610 family)